MKVLTQDKNVFHTVEQLGLKQSLTPEGYLLCQDVPISRIGTMIYGTFELPGIEGNLDGTIQVLRDEETVFDPVSIASFEGKSVSIDHPPEAISPATWKDLTVGTSMNYRRGTGEHKDHLVADLLITDQAAIDLVRTKKMEVSAGYDADYEQIRPGVARQTNIRGNHVALVPKGRCGPTCSIGDKIMTKLADRIWNAFRTRDAAELESALKDAEPGPGVDPGKNDVHIHLSDPKLTGVNPTDDAKKWEDVKNWRDSHDARMGKIEDAVKTMAESTDKLKSTFDAVMEKIKGKDEASVEGIEERRREEEAETKDKTKDATKTGDSRFMFDEVRETVSNAEIIAPGIKLPTFDAAMSAVQTSDALCKFRRAALTQAYTGDEAKPVIEKLLRGKQPTFDKMTCDAVTLMFHSTVDGVIDLRKAAGARRTVAPTTVGIPTNSQMNKRMREFWAGK